jgi:hypothetical protein
LATKSVAVMSDHDYEPVGFDNDSDNDASSRQGSHRSADPSAASSGCSHPLEAISPITGLILSEGQGRASHSTLGKRPAAHFGVKSAAKKAAGSFSASPSSASASVSTGGPLVTERPRQTALKSSHSSAIESPRQIALKSVHPSAIERPSRTWLNPAAIERSRQIEFESANSSAVEIPRQIALKSTSLPRGPPPPSAFGQRSQVVQPANRPSHVKSTQPPSSSNSVRKTAGRSTSALSNGQARAPVPVMAPPPPRRVVFKSLPRNGHDGVAHTRKTPKTYAPFAVHPRGDPNFLRQQQVRTLRAILYSCSNATISVSFSYPQNFRRLQAASHSVSRLRYQHYSFPQSFRPHAGRKSATTPAGNVRIPTKSSVQRIPDRFAADAQRQFRLQRKGRSEAGPLSNGRTFIPRMKARAAMIAITPSRRRIGPLAGAELVSLSSNVRNLDQMGVHFVDSALVNLRPRIASGDSDEDEDVEMGGPPVRLPRRRAHITPFIHVM